MPSLGRRPLIWGLADKLKPDPVIGCPCASAGLHNAVLIHGEHSAALGSSLMSLASRTKLTSCNGSLSASSAAQQSQLDSQARSAKVEKFRAELGQIRGRYRPQDAIRESKNARV